MTYIYIYIQDIIFNIYIFYRIQYELNRCLGLSGGSEKNTKSVRKRRKRETCEKRRKPPKKHTSRKMPKTRKTREKHKQCEKQWRKRENHEKREKSEKREKHEKHEKREKREKCETCENRSFFSRFSVFVFCAFLVVFVFLFFSFFALFSLSPINPRRAKCWLSPCPEVAPELLPFVRMFYGKPSSYCWWDEAGRCRDVPQGEGCEQGDSLASALFALGQHEALRTAASQLHPEDTLMAFLDDLYVVTSPGRARAALDTTTQAVYYRPNQRAIWYDFIQQP